MCHISMNTCIDCEGAISWQIVRCKSTVPGFVCLSSNLISNIDEWAIDLSSPLLSTTTTRGAPGG